MKIICRRCNTKMRRKRNYPFGIKSKPTIIYTCRNCKNCKEVKDA